jgi:hypothetical protein
MDDFHRELLDFIVRTHLEVQRNIRVVGPFMLTTVDDAVTMLTDMRDYFMWMVVRATKENARRVFDLLMDAGTYCQELGDLYHQGFFVALNQFIQLKFQLDIGELGDDAISYEKFIESWEKTCTNLGLEMREP